MRNSTFLLPLVATILLCSSHVQAQSAGEISAAANDIAANISAQDSAGSFDRAAQVKAIEQLGPLATDFIRLSDQAAFAGNAGAQRDSLRTAYTAIKQPLQKVYDKNNGYLQSATQKVIDEDGDLEALQDSEAYRNAQVVGSQALYFLNWLHYYGSRLYDGKESKDLLEKAQAGFSEFAVGDAHTDLTVESLLGRGLCNLELGNTEFAMHDLSAVAQDEKASQERRNKARFALLDAYVRTGNVKEALPLSEQLLATTSGDEANWVRFLRIRALLDAAKKTSGPGEGDRYKQLALAMMEQLRRGGSAWADRVTAMAQTEIQNPEEWSKRAQSPFAKWELAKLLVQKNDYATALPLLEDVVRSQDESLKSQMPEAHYILGLAKFKAGEYLESANQLDQALAGEKQSYAGDAAYVRFKALEAAVAADPTSVEPERYEKALRSFLNDYPQHASSFEAQYRLGEYQQAQGQFSQAIETYAKVAGDKSFELQAHFATMQCSFELLRGTTRDPARKALLQKIGGQLDQFEAEAAAYEAKARKDDQTPLKDIRAKAAVMRSVYLRQQPQVNQEAVLAALAGFETKYGPQEELLTQVVRVRLEMYQALGRFAEADAEVKAHPAEIAKFEPAQIEQLAVGFIREGAKRNGRGDTAANEAAQQVALRFYEGLATNEASSVKTQLTLARLYENTGKLDKSRELYQQVMDAKGDSASALRGLGRIAEKEKRLDDAVGYWKKLVAGTRAGDFPWYESSYELARLTQAQGKTEESCRQLTEMKPAMPGLSDADLRVKLDALYKQVCK